MSWLMQLSHDSLNTLQFSDSLFADLLNNLENDGILENTILILVSDHGYNFGGIRETLTGYYENKLPALWIRLPAQIKKSHPDWESSLKNNAR